MSKSLIIPNEHAITTRPRERGVALLLALVVTIILTVVVLEFNYFIRVHATLSGHSVDDLKARVAADSGVEMAKALLINDVVADSEDGFMVDAFDEEWALGIELETGGSETSVHISDEMSKLNLNRLINRAETEFDIETTNTEMIETLRRLFESLDLDPNLVDEVVDWLDENDEEEAFGAESGYYESLDPPIRCKNGPMDSVEELLLIEGFNKEIFFGDEESPGLIEFVTICGEEDGRVNINTAPEELIAALTNNESVAERIVGMREDAPFENAEDMANRLPEGELTEKFTTYSSFFLISSSARIFKGGPDSKEEPLREVRIEALVKRVQSDEEDEEDEGDYFSIDTASWKANR